MFWIGLSTGIFIGYCIGVYSVRRGLESRVRKYKSPTLDDQHFI